MKNLKRYIDIINLIKEIRVVTDWSKIVFSYKKTIHGLNSTG
jgi:hypothetical protein